MQERSYCNPGRSAFFSTKMDRAAPTGLSYPLRQAAANAWSGLSPHPVLFTLAL
jgi:hypothetical protein